MEIDFGRWAFKNSKLMSFLIAVLVMGGVFAYYDMSKLEDPEIKVRQALVIGVYPDYADGFVSSKQRKCEELNNQGAHIRFIDFEQLFEMMGETLP